MSKTPYDPNNPDVDAILQQQRKAWKERQRMQRFKNLPLLANIIIATFAVVLALGSFSLPNHYNYWLQVALSCLVLINALLVCHRFFRPDPQPPTVQDELETWRG